MQSAAQSAPLHGRPMGSGERNRRPLHLAPDPMEFPRQSFPGVERPLGLAHIVALILTAHSDLVNTLQLSETLGVN